MILAKSFHPEQMALNFDNMKAPDIAVWEEERMKRLEAARQSIVAAQKKQKDDFDRRQA